MFTHVEKCNRSQQHNRETATVRSQRHIENEQTKIETKQEHAQEQEHE
jgi:hypothetical protein